MLTDGKMTKKEFNEIVRLVWKEEKYERENMKLMMTIPLNYVMNSTSPNGNGLYDMSHVVDGDHEDDEGKCSKRRSSSCNYRQSNFY